ncbi:family 76 putative glycoside hydrolase [Podospora australis]|uniref:Family 76 putative glycoside hydrolase n=1 Tax=Podospora australis TaxID=1536484 RepID=A0AAN6WR03_9PEZI|nr:family 76 putative glycoside hydrolase [Podospora australis]
MRIKLAAVAMAGAATGTAALKPPPIAMGLGGRCGSPKDSSSITGKPLPTIPGTQSFLNLVEAMEDMQKCWFEHSAGTWPTGIDWTRAVMGAHLAATLRVISKDYTQHGPYDGNIDNVIGRYFGHLISYYFGEDTFALRGQAYDDILWVAMGWLETIQLINEQPAVVTDQGVEEWYGADWRPTFAHRARIFWELGEKGWDTTLCGGGMNWNPKLEPYKNAITNELWISASIGMYHHFPGDNDSSPWRFFDAKSPKQRVLSRQVLPPSDRVFLESAEKGYKWLLESGMRHWEGMRKDLFADGFHIGGRKEGNTKCNLLDPMVYTYNQGVILSGLLGLYTATGKEEYLDEGHGLIRAVIRATGWDIEAQKPIGDISKHGPGRFPPWKGLGRYGILEEECDLPRTCNQDSEAFKGILMHHLGTFCAPNSTLDLSGKIENPNQTEYDRLHGKHQVNCKLYLPWLEHNCKAVLNTRDKYGRFGGWWFPGLLKDTNVRLLYVPPEAIPPNRGVDDYRNNGVPRNSTMWQLEENVHTEERGKNHKRENTWPAPTEGFYISGEAGAPEDPSLWGRGRTLETQGSAIGLLRAHWLVSQIP